MWIVVLKTFFDGAVNYGVQTLNTKRNTIQKDITAKKKVLSLKRGFGGPHGP